MDNIIQRIADYADIDTRRAMGVYRRLPPSNFKPRPIPPTSWRYWPATRTAIFTNFTPEYGFVEFEIHKELIYTPELDTHWMYGPGAHVRSVYNNQEGMDSRPAPGFGFSFAEKPEFKT